MDRCTGRQDITEIPLKMVLNTTQLLDQSLRSFAVGNV